MKNIQWKPFIISILFALGAGAFAARLTQGNQMLYATLNKPPGSPPAMLFSVVWTILYILMGISAYLIYVSDSPKKKDALFIYVAQLVLNIAWSVIFFNLREYWLAFVWIVALWMSIYTMIKVYYEIDKRAAYLQIPYLLWVTYAAYLTLGIYYLN